MTDKELYEKLGTDGITDGLKADMERRIERDEEYYSSDDYILESADGYGDWAHDFDLDNVLTPKRYGSDWDDDLVEVIKYLLKIGVDEDDVIEALKDSAEPEVSHGYSRNSDNSMGFQHAGGGEQQNDMDLSWEKATIEGVEKTWEEWLKILLKFDQDEAKDWIDKLDWSRRDDEKLKKGEVPDSISYYIHTDENSGVDYIVDKKRFFREAKSFIRSWKQAKKHADPKLMKPLIDEVKEKTEEENEDKDRWASSLIAVVNNERKEKKAALIAAQGDQMENMKDAAHMEWMKKQAESSQEVDAAKTDEKLMAKWLAGEQKVSEIPAAFSAEGDVAHSYNTVIAKKKDKTLFVNMTKYSKTTTKLQQALVNLGMQAGYDVQQKDGAFFRTSMPYKYKMGEHKQKQIGEGKVMANIDKEALKELLSEVFHEAWMHWSQAVADDVPPERKAKWEENWVPYEQLDDSTKDLDREWADEAMQMIDPILEPVGPPEEGEGLDGDPTLDEEIDNESEGLPLDIDLDAEDLNVENLDENSDDSLREKEDGEALEMVMKVGAKYPGLLALCVESAGKAEGHCYSTWMSGLKKLGEAQEVFNQAMGMSASEQLPIEVKSELADLISQVYGLQSQVSAVMEELAEVDEGGPGPAPEEKEEKPEAEKPAE